MVVSCQMSGCYEGFTDYWGLWNGVDWLNIGMGLTSISLWLFSCMAMQAPSVRALLDAEAPDGIVPGIMALDSSDLEQVEADLEWINFLYFYLHCAMGINGISIVAKFFKAFQANPRLRLVTDTLVRAAMDIAHFSIIFLAVFIAFAVLG